MRFGAGNVWQGLVQAALVAGVLTGCGGGAGDAEASKSAADAPAERGGTIGSAGSACELPVTFALAEGWKAEAVDAEAYGGSSGSAAPEEELAEEIADAILHQGPVTGACEIDAKPAGHIGFLRVWTGEPGDADTRGVLEAFVTAEEGTSGAKYSTFKTEHVSGVEVKYLMTSELLNETKQERALAVTTPKGPVVLHLGGMDDEEHEAMLPAFQLAKRTLRIAG